MHVHTSARHGNLHGSSVVGVGSTSGSTAFKHVMAAPVHRCSDTRRPFFSSFFLFVLPFFFFFIDKAQPLVNSEPAATRFCPLWLVAASTAQYSLYQKIPLHNASEKHPFTPRVCTGACVPALTVVRGGVAFVTERDIFGNTYCSCMSLCVVFGEYVCMTGGSSASS